MTDTPKTNDPFGLGSTVKTIRDSVQGIFDAFQPPTEPEEDWSNPDFVLGAVLAQLEDLSAEVKCQVLAEALTVVIAELSAMTAITAGVERVIECALRWQEAVDTLVAFAPLPNDDPVAKAAIARATEAHMALLHATRDLREASGV